MHFATLLHIGVLLAFGQFASDALAQQNPSKGVFIGRLQLAQQTDHIVRLSVSTYSANAEGTFFLQALDHNHDTETDRALLTRWQAYYGGPLPFKDTVSVWGWVGRLEAVRASPNRESPYVHLADSRWGLQFNVNRIPALADWFKVQNANLFVQVFPLRTNNDFGSWDTFMRFSKRFAPQVVTRYYMRTFRMDGYTAVTLENDLIYEMQRDLDIFFRIGKGSHDVLGISDNRWIAGIGMRLNF